MVVLSALAIWVACAAPGIAQYDVADAVGLWLMDDGEGEVATDSSATGDDGALWRSPEWVDGRFGKALHFKDEAFIWIKEATGVPEGTTARTLMCQFKMDDPASESWQVLMSHGKNNWRQMIVLGFFPDLGPGIYTHDDREYFEWDGDMEWHHMAAVFPEGATQSNEFLFYLDGVPQETFIDDDVNGITTVGGVITIGCATWIGSFFNGIIDDVAVFPSSRRVAAAPRART